MRYRSLTLTLALGLLVVMLLASCSSSPRETETLRQLTILHTNDEHGWMGSYRGSGGADGLLRRWERNEGYRTDGAFLVISSGDMWTGPAISTVLEGESMVDVMNALGYRSATLGNHDFDFGQDVIRQRRQEANFPFLGANIRVRSTGELPDYLEPYTLVDVNAIRVGILGVTTKETPVDTRPSNVDDLEFRPYAEALEQYVPEMRAAGADLIIVAGHICGTETEALADTAAALGVAVIAGGHCHERINEVLHGVRLIESESFLQGYTRLDVWVDTAQDRVVEMRAEYKPNRRGPSDPAMALRVAGWAQRLPAGMLDPIGYVGENIDRASPEMRRLLVQAWLEADPDSDVALASVRYVQQDLLPGEVSEATVIGLLSTNNILVRIELTGEELVQVLKRHRPLAAGITEDAEGYRMRDGSPLDPAASYTVLLPDTLYLGGNSYRVADFDPSPTPTGIDWRAPTLDLLRSLGSDRQHPLDELLAGLVAP